MSIRGVGREVYVFSRPAPVDWLARRFRRIVVAMSLQIRTAKTSIRQGA